jgi:pyruvate kinase
MADMEFALSKGVDWIAQSFVQSAEDVEEAKKFINGRAKLIAKLEKPDAITNLKEIVAAADAIMVARGDLAVETPQEEVPAVQHAMIMEAIAQDKPVVVATHMFESMINNPRPTRAEISDVALAVRQGASAVMLSGETTIGKYPVEAVTIMDQTVHHAETNDLYSRKTLKSAVAPPLVPRPSLQAPPARNPAPKLKFG